MAVLAPALRVLRAQINAVAALRDKRLDGWIGDSAHAARTSDHNPAGGVVHALDITDDDVGDPALGQMFDATALFHHLISVRDRRISCLIHQGIIVSGPAGPAPWTRRRRGKGPADHAHHLHVSCRRGTWAADTRPWSLPAQSPAPLPVSVLTRGSTGDEVAALQRGLRAVFPAYAAHLVVDGVYGAATAAVVAIFQGRSGLVADGIVGPATRAELARYTIMGHAITTAPKGKPS